MTCIEVKDVGAQIHDSVQPLSLKERRKKNIKSQFLFGTAHVHLSTEMRRKRDGSLFHCQLWKKLCICAMKHDTPEKKNRRQTCLLAMGKKLVVFFLRVYPCLKTQIRANSGLRIV